MFQQLLLTVIFATLTSGASSVTLVSARAEPRSSQSPNTQAVSSTAAVAATHEQEIPGSKPGETGFGAVAATYGGYGTGNQGPQPLPNVFPAPTAINSYVYGNGNPGNNQIFGLSSNGDVTLSAYFGPIFWGFFAGLAAGIIVVLIVNIFGGFDFLGSAIRGIGSDDKKSSNGKARAIDLDRLASLVYSAMDKYNKWN